jgi:hypothetical protein
VNTPKALNHSAQGWRELARAYLGRSQRDINPNEG